MLTHRGFSAWVVADGKPADEYLVAVDAKAHRVQCWIPSESGKTFSVYWRDHGGKVDTCTFITLDGIVVPGRFLFGSGVASRGGVRTGYTTERPFTFSRVDEGGEGDNNAAECQSKDVGMIVLRVKRVERLGSRAPDDLLKVPNIRKGRNTGDLRIGFGQEKETYERYPNTWSVNRKDGGRSYVTFVFRYRTKEFLLDQGIMTEVPKSTTPPIRAPIRRIASAPVTSGVTPEPITPTPSPSPRPKKRADHKFAPYTLLSRQRKLVNTPRILSLRVARSDRYPGESILRFEDSHPKAVDKEEARPVEEDRGGSD